MPNDFSQKTVFGIKIGDFTGIYRAIADKANVNGGNTLVGKEINLFYEAKNTIDKSKSIFQFDGKTYDSEGKLYTGKAPLIAEPDATMVKFSWHPKPDDFFKTEEVRLKNEAALQKVDEYIAVEKIENEKIKQKVHDAIVLELNKRGKKDADVDYWTNIVVQIAKAYNCPPEIIVGIIGRETKFTKHVDASGGSGPMQITGIGMTDSFPSPKNGWYSIWKQVDETLSDEIFYKTGKDGKKVLRYSSPKELRNACAKDDEFGVKCGTFCFKMAYVKAVATKLYGSANFSTIPKAINEIKKGNVKFSESQNKEVLNLAFQYYNTTEIKVSYANDVINSLEKMGFDFSQQNFI